MIIPDQRELELIKKFRENLESQNVELIPEILYRDLHLLRWIRTTGHDLKKSEEMLKKSLAWRKAIGADELINWEPPEFMKKFLEIQYLGKDKQGNCVFLYPEKKSWDMTRFCEEGQKENCEKFFAKLNEIYLRFICDAYDEKGLAQIVVIYDYKNLPISQLMNLRGRERLRERNQSYDANYPELLGNAILVNSPMAFTMIYQMLRPLISERIRHKFTVISTDPPKWKASILNQVSSDIIPKHYGGTRRHPALHICTREEILEPTEDELEEGLISLTIASRQILSIDFATQEPQTLISLMVKVNSYDIGISVVSAASSEPVVPFEKIKSTKKSSFTANAPSKYSLIIDNSYSRSRSKTVYYNIIKKKN